MDISDEFNCCGLREITDLSSHREPEEAFLNLLRLLNNPYYPRTRRWRHAVFTEAKGNYGRKFATFLRQNHLGKVVCTPKEINPNSGNPLRAFVWTVDWPAVEAWEQANQPALDALRFSDDFCD